jgi:hypothetical protein
MRHTRFTIKHLMAAVAVAAVISAIVRPLGAIAAIVLGVVTAGPLAGALLQRAFGGGGIIGGTVGGLIPCFGLVFLVYANGVPTMLGLDSQTTLLMFLILAFLSAYLGMIVGALVKLCATAIRLGTPAGHGGSRNLARGGGRGGP